MYLALKLKQFAMKLFNLIGFVCYKMSFVLDDITTTAEGLDTYHIVKDAGRYR